MTTQSTVYPEAKVSHSGKATPEGRSAMDAIEAAVPDLNVKLRHMVATGKTNVTEWKDGFQDAVREKPVQSVLIAAAVGAFIGLIVGRRTDGCVAWSQYPFTGRPV